MAAEKHFIQEGIIHSEIESYMRSKLNRAGYSGVEIQKTPFATRIILYVEKPPLVIGKRGKRIDTMTEVLRSKYGLENPTIDVQKVEQPTLDPNIVSRRIATALERGLNRRRVVYKALRAVMSSGARGVEITLSGKIVGKGGRSRTEKYLEGYMKKAGDAVKLVKVGSTQASLKAGVIGVGVKIVPPGTIFPDQITVIKRVPEAEKKEKEAPKEMPEEKKDVAAKPKEKPEAKKEKLAPLKGEEPVKAAVEKPAPAKKDKKTEKKPAAKKTTRKINPD
ncbi:MAG: 30S ribosomal protein S3 [Candidatus Altiarchaeales archaeon IMC4]|nr:ribosomal protein S3 [uncultured archaeon]ODS42744.1 MAG: 30S ribosomal protein S3 [Candidatus Altiarchaeales archaeon IMC4]